MMDMLHAVHVFVPTNSAGEVVEESNHTHHKLPALARTLDPFNLGAGSGAKVSPLGHISKKHVLRRSTMRVVEQT